MNHVWFTGIPRLLRNRLHRSLGLQRILANVGWLFFDRGLRLGIGLFVGAWTARYLGPAQFGLLNYVFAYVALFSAVATLGLDGIVVRDIVRDPASREKTLGTTFALKLVGGSCMLLLTISFALLLHPSDPEIPWLVGVVAASTIFQAFDVIDFWFQSQVQSRYSVYAKSFAYLVAAGLRVALIQTQAPLIAFALAGLLEAVLSAIGLVTVYYSKGQSFGVWKASAGRARELLAVSWPLILSAFAVMVYMRIDQLMLKYMAGDGAVGIYAAATRISEMWYFIPSAIVSSVTPSIIEAKRAGEALYYRRMQWLFDIMSALAFLIAIPMTFFSTATVVLLFGQDYVEAGSVLTVHIWASLFVFLGVAQGPWDVTEGLTRLALGRAVFGAIVNIVLNLILIPVYGAMGAAVATVLAYAASAVLTNGLSTKTRKILSLQAKSLLFARYLFT